ncbi:MAG: hypothetical protein HY000_42050 [Planctomycetes bacterium]|nr:hypothetical protein [Planctomycetota bacterium]
MLISIHAPKNLSAEESGAIVRTLRSRRFHAAFERSVRQFFSRYPALRLVSLTISR